MTNILVEIYAVVLKLIVYQLLMNFWQVLNIIMKHGIILNLNYAKEMNAI